MKRRMPVPELIVVGQYIQTHLEELEEVAKEGGINGVVKHLNDKLGGLLTGPITKGHLATFKRTMKLTLPKRHSRQGKLNAVLQMIDDLKKEVALLKEKVTTLAANTIR